MRLKKLYVLLFLLVIFMVSTGFRCGNKVVTKEMSRWDILDICGKPAWVIDDGYIISGNEILKAETWVFSIGKGKLNRIVKWRGGDIYEIETGKRE